MVQLRIGSTSLVDKYGLSMMSILVLRYCLSVWWNLAASDAMDDVADISDMKNVT